MITTANGNKIEYQTLAQKLATAINSKEITVQPVTIDCFNKDNNLVVIVEHKERKAPDSQLILAIINQIIAQEKITNKVLIYLTDNSEKLENNDNNQLIKQLDYYQKNEQIDTSKIEKTQVELNGIKNKNKVYKSKNFSVGLISFISGLIFLGIVGTIYYFSRPCVLKECSILSETESKIDNLLQTIKPDTQADYLEQIQATISESNEELKRIPSWSKSYDSAQDLIQKYNKKNKKLSAVLSAFELSNNAENMSKNLPLSETEWERLKGFWQDAIVVLNQNEEPEFDLLIAQKIKGYQNEIKTVNQRIEQEKLAEKLLAESQVLANQVQAKQQQEIDSFATLETLEKDWKAVVEKVENIPTDTIAYQQKDELLNSYLEQLLGIQNKIKVEQSASNLLVEIQDKINLAKKSQQDNQWTKAVSYWEEGKKLLENAPENSFLTENFQQLKKEIEPELNQAKNELKLAVIRDNIRSDLQKICVTNGTICNYSVTNNLIKVYLTDKYLQNVAKISTQANEQQKQQLYEHINQVEENYKFISSKYKKPLEVYNPEKELIIEYQ